MSEVEIWEQKLNLAQEITGKTFTLSQKNIFVESERDVILGLFIRQEGQTTAGVSYALVNAYWKPNFKCLYVTADTLLQSANSFSVAKVFLTSFKKHRPERTYRTTANNVSIYFGETESQIVFCQSNLKLSGSEYDTVILDIHDNTLNVESLISYANSVKYRGQLLIMPQLQNESPIGKSSAYNRLDSMLENLS